MTSETPRPSRQSSEKPEQAAAEQLRTLTHFEWDAPQEDSAANPSSGRFQVGAPEERYRILGFIGEGGMGEVFRATDRLLGRDVALKYLKDATTEDVERLQHFWDEVTTAGLLDHPNIPPVFDIGIDHQSRPFYVMRLIRGRSLREILADGPMDFVMALTTFLQVCAAMEFAHSRGILHLDLKPENVMVGSFDEVYLVDWGLSFRTGNTGEPQRRQQRSPRGTPAYMSPEQSRRDARLTATSDVFSLGIMLFELTTGQHPFLAPGDTSESVINRIRRADVRKSSGWPSIRPELQEVLERALKSNADTRVSTVSELVEQVRAVLTGTKERERNARLARSALERSGVALSNRESAISIMRDLGQRIREERPESWQPAEQKRAFWKLEDEHALQAAAADQFGESALAALREALSLIPHDGEVRLQLSELLLDRFKQAEIEKKRFEMRFFETELRKLEMSKIDSFLEGDGCLRLHCEPSPDQAVLYRLEQVDRRLVPVDPVEITRSMESHHLPMGSYWIRCSHPDFATLEAPIHIGRGQTVALNWRLRRREAIGNGFLQIPASSFIMGGDPNTFMSTERREPWVDEFAIARYPVTWSDYQEYLQNIADGDPETARQLLPPILGNSKKCWILRNSGEVVYAVTEEVIKARGRWPIFQITYEQARAYVDWRSKKDKKRYDLPTDEEWEKAARGVDGRIFPWGDHYDPTFCKNVESSAGNAQPEPSGAYELDCSPYGVRDMAGGIREWCSSWFSQKNKQRLVRGGSWNFGEIGAHAAYRLGCSPDLAYPFIGFRLVHRFAPYTG